jgi:hypothetical protein
MATTTGDKSRGGRNSLLRRTMEQSEQYQFSTENDANAETLPDERLIELQARLDKMRGQVEAILTSFSRSDNRPDPA